MRTVDLKKLSSEDLQTRLVKVQIETRDFLLDVRTGKELNHASLKQMKKEIARIQTLLNEVTKAKNIADIQAKK